MLPWQAAAVEKLLHLRVGALYMEMGTGKTRTCLEFISRRIDGGKMAKAIWLCPCSVKGNLRNDLAKHCDGWESVIQIHGIESLSGSLSLYERLMKEADMDTMIVVDESNLVKNHHAIRTMRITNIAEKCKYRMILNGTPVSRNEGDLFSQWYILDYRILGFRSYWAFSNKHLEYDPDIPGKIVRVLGVDTLIKKIEPYSFQVLKSECFELPEKKCETICTSLDAEQDEHYCEMVEHMLGQIDERKPETVYRMFSAAQSIISGLWVKDNNGHLETRPMFGSPMDNPRIADLMACVDEFIKDEQCIIFCKYTHEITSILALMGNRALPFYGDIKAKDRDANVAAFRDGKAQFLVGNKTCAGYGLNLQFCRNVIYYSNDWDYATRAQSEDRVHRFGQTREVRIFDIVAEGTLDERIMSCLRRKEGLEADVKRALAGSGTSKAALRKMMMGNGKEKKNGKGVHEPKRP